VKGVQVIRDGIYSNTHNYMHGQKKELFTIGLIQRDIKRLKNIGKSLLRKFKKNIPIV
jgi:hypothetical protein